ncbi:MAG: membrane protein [Cyanobium sp. CACIAM 14]|nr:MAG: membrane protein [Cyanobium sp. CACIAM 14]
MDNFLHNQVIGVPPTHPSLSGPWPALQLPAVPAAARMPLAAVFLVTVPVFLQAPWVRVAPMAAALFTIPLLTVALLLERHGRGDWQALGVLLVGFSGSWLGGSLFWGWCRLHPVLHLPLESFALPLALAGLGGRWRLAGGFYLASLLGTAATDAAIAASGLMDLWPQVLNAPLAEAPQLLQEAALQVLQPWPLTLVMLAGALLAWIGLLLWRRGGPWRVGAAALGTTVAVDALFLLAALLSPQLSGLI